VDRAFWLSLALCGLAGWVDAVGVTQTGGVFLSFMSGNTTDLAAGLVHRDWPRAAFIAAVIPLFVAGVVAGEAIGRLGTGRLSPSCVLVAEAAVLACAAALHPDGALAYPLVLAMGMQNATIHRAGLTFVTGTLVRLGRCIADRDAAKAAEHLIVWLSLAVGAAGGAFAQARSAGVALIAPAVTAAVLAAVSGALPVAAAPADRAAGD
jgi:uncharacterized membrane protein YoaK (UPF0700 family)